MDEFGNSAPSSSTGQIFVIDDTSGSVQIGGQSALQSLTLTNATTIAATDGGAISDASASALDVSHVVFTSDTATGSGGALYDVTGLVAVDNCTFGMTNLDFNTSGTGVAGGRGGDVYGGGVDDNGSNFAGSVLTINNNTATGGQGAPARLAPPPLRPHRRPRRRRLLPSWLTGHAQPFVRVGRALHSHYLRHRQPEQHRLKHVYRERDRHLPNRREFAGHTVEHGGRHAVVLPGIVHRSQSRRKLGRGS